MAMAPGSNPGRGANVQWFSIRWAQVASRPKIREAAQSSLLACFGQCQVLGFRRRRHDLHQCGARRSAPVDPGQLRDKFASQGLDAAPSTAEAFTAHIRAEVPKWIRVAKSANIKVE